MELLKNKVKSAYIHIPFCKSICSYCDFCKVYYSTHLASVYLDALDKEIKKYYKGDILDTIYIGGGTPSSLSISELNKLFSSIKRFNISKNVEFTFECNIEDISIELLELLKNNGVNRISIGIESFNKDILKILNRRYDIDIFKKVKLCKKYFDNINIDLMYAIPTENMDILKNDINNILKLDVKHISTYSLIINKNTVMYNKGISNIDEDIDYKMYNLIIDKLKDKYKHYEISNFAKAGYESKHNLTYWNNEYYYAFGVGASGYIDNIRYDNIKSITKYINGNYDRLINKLSYNETVENAFILGFRKIDGININDFICKYKFDLRSLDIIKKLVKENKLILDEYNIKINNKYLYTSNDILINFLDIDYEFEKKNNK